MRPLFLERQWGGRTWDELLRDGPEGRDAEIDEAVDLMEAVGARVYAPLEQIDRSNRHTTPAEGDGEAASWAVTEAQQYYGGTLSCRRSAATEMEATRLAGDAARV